jgi:hypothetical protein
MVPEQEMQGQKTYCSHEATRSTGEGKSIKTRLFLRHILSKDKL